MRHFERNLIFSGKKNEAWACFKMVGFNYDFKSNESKINILNSLSRFISKLGREAVIHIVPIQQDIDKHYELLKQELNKDDVSYREAIAHAEQTCEYLKEKIRRRGNINDYKVYIYTLLEKKESILDDVKDGIQYFLREPGGAIEEFLVSNVTRDIYIKDIEMFSDLSNEFLRKQSRRIKIEECTPADIEWLIRRPFWRGIGNFQLRNTEENQWTPFAEEIIKNGQKAIRTDEREILRLAEGKIDISNGKYIKVQQGEKEAYQTFLSIAHIPDIAFPGYEWILALQDYSVQTEVIIRLSTIEHKQSIRNIEKKKKEIKDQTEHIIESEADELPEELAYAREYANELESELKATKSPLAETSITLCLFAETVEELNAKVDFIKEIYTDGNFIIERSTADQYKFFIESIPGTDRIVKDYALQLPPRTLAGGMIGATRLLGDAVGPYIGTTGVLNKNVYLDLSRACRLNRSASGACFGTLGGGKSFSANLLFYLQCLYGAKGLVIDPKGERGNWIDDLVEFKGQISITTLSTDPKDRGKLDPWNIYKDDKEQASYLTITILSELFNISPKDDEYIAILEAIEYVKGLDNRSMTAVREKLLNMSDYDLGEVAVKMGKRMKLLSNMALAALLFGNGNEEGLDFDKKINILQIQNLTMPSPQKTREEYTQEEVLSTVLMIPIASFARQFIHQDRRFYKQVLFDEAWALNATTAGKQMMNSLMREGRALNAGCLFISQSTKDANDEGIKTNMSYKFCFLATETKEVESVLEFLDLDVTDENIETVKNLKNGECLFQDLDGRVGLLKFDAVYEHLITRAFNTNPEKLKEKEGV